MHPLAKELLGHNHVQIALGVVGVILVASVSYYLIESHPPTLSYVAASSGSIAQTITGNGEVSPIENPELSFAVGGRVTVVRAQVGQKVGAGAVLATLDTGVLSASLAGAQAQLDKLTAGPRGVDVAGKQTALLSAEQSQSDALAAAEGDAESVIAMTNPLFIDAGSNPRLQGYLVSDYSSTEKIRLERRALNEEIDSWRKEKNTITVDATLVHLRNVSAYLNDLIVIVNNSHGTDTDSRTAISTWLSSVTAARASIDSLITSVGQKQLTVQAAQDQLNLTNAGAPLEDIAAQRAQVAGIAAQLRQQEVIAPFNGTVASVSVKEGDVVAPNTVAISLVPEGTFEVPVYVSEIEMTKMSEGDSADVTLDAYGAGRVFPATVGLIDRAPSTNPKGGSGYKITLVFSQSDTALAVGMHANAVIHGGSKEQTLIVPRSAIITDGTGTFVLKKTTTGPIKTPVTVGLISNESAEVLGGLTAGDMIANVGTR